MQARSRLLEPYYAFRLEVPPEQLGRAISDVRLRSGSFDAPEEAGDMTLLRGRVPVTEFDDYAQEVASYTGGRGRLSLEPAGYGPCHNPDAVIAAADYNPEADLENTPDSVFCAHGGGFPVKWNRPSWPGSSAPSAAPCTGLRKSGKRCRTPACGRSASGTMWWMGTTSSSTGTSSTPWRTGTCPPPGSG